jgi:hypothetical protein
MPVLQSLESLIAGFDSANDSEMAIGLDEPGSVSSGRTRSAHNDVQFVHSFDTDRRDLRRCGCVLELRERSGSFIITAVGSAAERDEGSPDAPTRVQAQIDSRWAMQILSGGLSPLVALERRLGRPTPWLVGQVSAAAGDRALRRVNSSTTTSAPERPEGPVVAGESMARPGALLRLARSSSAPAAASGSRAPSAASSEAGSVYTEFAGVRSDSRVHSRSAWEQESSTRAVRTSS